MNSSWGVSGYLMTKPTKSTASVARLARAVSPSLLVWAAATSIRESWPVPTSPTEVAMPAFANPVRLPAEKLPRVAGGSASSSTTGTTMTPRIHASREVIGLGERTLEEAARPSDASVSSTAPTGTTQAVRVDR
jgi:hypothetical protein